MKFSVVLSIQQAQFQAATFKGNLEANLRTIAALGYAGVELAIRDPKIVDLDELDRLTRDCNLSVPAIGTGQAWGEEGLSFTDPDPSVRQAAMERILSHIPVASRFGAVIIIGLIRGTLNPGVDQAQAMDWLVDALHECTRAALPHGVRLALEPINHTETSLINTAAQGLDLIERVGAANFGLLLDTFHMRIEETNIENTIKICGANIYHFHVADSNRCAPGAGNLDFESILKVLFATGYSGWVSGEFLPKPDAESAARLAINSLKRIAGI